MTRMRARKRVKRRARRPGRVVIVRRPIRKIIVRRVIKKIIVKRPIKRIIIKRVARPRLPRVKIVYSGVYDEAIHALLEKRHTKHSRMGGRLFARRLRRAVRPVLKRFLTSIETMTGLSWRWPAIRCHVVHDIPFDFDDPMTIKVRRNMRDAAETFFHELAHQLEMQNRHRIRLRNYIAKKYAGESKDTRDHILAHAILWKVYEKLYGRKRLKRIIAGYTLWPHHYRGWQIVKSEGADRILKAYLK